MTDRSIPKNTDWEMTSKTSTLGVCSSQFTEVPFLYHSSFEIVDMD